MAATLHPVSGPAPQVYEQVQRWLAEDQPRPLEIQTSGSTGTPKKVLLSRDAVRWSAEASVRQLGGPGQWLQAIPVAGAGGLQVLVRSAIAGLEPLYLADYGSLAEAAEAMTRQRRYISLVPTQVARLAAQDKLDVLRSFDGVLVGGAPMAPTLLEQVNSAQLPIVRTYGMSETAGGCVYDGYPLDGVGVRINAEQRVELAGPMLFDGYVSARASGEGQVTEPRRGSWWTTSDVGELAADGQLRILGRADDVVISGGVNIVPQVVERAALQLPSVTDIVVCGVADPHWGQRLVALVVGEVTLDELAEATTAAGHPSSWVPKQIVRTDEIPLLPGGKVDRRAAREQWLATVAADDC